MQDPTPAENDPFLAKQAADRRARNKAKALRRARRAGPLGPSAADAVAELRRRSAKEKRERRRQARRVWSREEGKRQKAEMLARVRNVRPGPSVAFDLGAP